MYDPKVRLVILIYTIVTIWATVSALYSYFFGEKGLDWATHIQGIGIIGSSIMGGFLFIWLSIQFITFGKHKKTGFEAVFVDDTGTGFNFPVSLSKFLPDIVALPYDERLHPLEAELVGFLNAYRHWPYDVKNPKGISLYAHALTQWYAMRSLPGAGPLHRAAALAQDLSLVHAYKEKRKSYPYSHFWKRDSISFSRRCLEHGGMSAFILSTFTCFRTLGQDDQNNQRYRRSLLTAIRYRDNPTSIPANCDPLAREIYEYLHRAAQKAEKKETGDTEFSPSSEHIAAFDKEIYAYLQGIVRDLEVNPVGINNNHDGVYLGDGVVLISLPRITKKYANVLSPGTRGAFNLWEVSEEKHVCWKYVLQALDKQGVLLKEWEEVKTTTGTFDVHIQEVHFPYAFFIRLNNEDFPEVRSSLNTLPKWNGVIYMEQNKNTILEEVKKKAKATDAMLARIYDEPVIT